MASDNWPAPRRVLAGLAGIAAVTLVLALSAGAFLRQREIVLHDAKKEIAAIGQLKAGQILRWREERLSDGRIITNNPIIAARLRDLLNSSDVENARRDFRLWIDALRASNGYHDVVLVDARLIPLLAVGADEPDLPEPARQTVRAAFAEGRPVLSDFHRRDSADVIHLDLAAPLFDGPVGSEDRRPLGALLLRMDPGLFLYPLLQTWPSLSSSGETLLVRRDGDDVLFLNELRRREHTALELRMPLSSGELPAAMAVRGKRGVIIGRDYRGVDVLADIRAVPDTPWFLITKVDQAEALAPFRSWARLAATALLTLLGGCVLLLAWWWKRRETEVYRRLYETERQRQSIAERYTDVTSHANDMLIRFDANRTIVEVNDGACRRLGYAREELIGQPIDFIRAPEARAGLNGQFQSADADGVVFFETVNQRKDGSTFPTEVSIRPVWFGGEKFFQGIGRDVSERKAAEETLRRSEKKYRDLVEGGSDIIWEADRTGRLTYVSPQNERVFGYPPAEVIGRGMFDLASETELAPLRELLESAAEAASSLRNVECAGRARDGRRLFVEVSAAPFFDDHGAVAGLRGACRDITARRESEQAVETLVEAVSSYTGAEFFAHVAERVTRYLEADFTILGELVGRGEIRALTAVMDGRSLGALHYPIAGTPCERALTGGFQHFPRDLSSLFPDDPTVRAQGFVAYVGAPLLDENGRGIGVLCALSRREIQLPRGAQEVMRIVAAKASVEVRRLRSERALRDSEYRLREMLETVQMVAVMLDPDGRIVFCNEYLAAISGYAKEEMLDRDWFSLFIAPGDADRVRAVFLGCIAGGDYPAHFENSILTKAGVPRLIVWDNTLLRDAQGVVIGTASLGRDITEQRALESQLAQAQKMESVGRLAGGVAHDFNNILTAIAGHAEMALAALTPAEPIHEDLLGIQDAAAKAASLTAQLLAFSRKQVIAPKVIDLNELVAKASKMLQRLIGEDIDLAIRPGANLAPVKVDPGQLEQALVNLAVNARDAMPHGGRLTIETGEATIDEEYCRLHVEALAGRYVVLAVSDDGQGMTPEVIARIFEPFYTTKEPGRGTGLGLSTVYGIVKQLGGFVNVYSEVGLGTSFKVYLPAAAGVPVPLASRAARSAPAGHERVLLVEDDEMVRDLARRILERQGYAVTAAAGSVEALADCERHGVPYDLLLTDVVMPRMNGRQLHQRLQALKPQLKALYMSGYTENAIAHHGVLDEGMQFLQKPFTIESLARKVREALDADGAGDAAPRAKGPARDD